ncbi:MULTISPECIES: hypothetical protein [Methylobacterium]|uniref:hypothetical protein n=1 Tax=Methylobacterium TaxID=407 RepID=UPI0010467E8B|nr:MULTISPECIES: hypothetical protein [Methylobacterium]MDR7040174.1 hypothetical protein [Methylobacterium sp. BE186]
MRTLHLLVIASGLAACAFWATMLTKPPRSQARMHAHIVLPQPAPAAIPRDRYDADDFDAF